jgi:hypothetical protein
MTEGAWLTLYGAWTILVVLGLSVAIVLLAPWMLG